MHRLSEDSKITSLIQKLNIANLPAIRIITIASLTGLIQIIIFLSTYMLSLTG